MKETEFIFNDTIEEHATPSYFIINMFSNLPLKLDSIKNGWFHHSCSFEANYRMLREKKVDYFSAYKLEFNIKPSDFNTYNIKYNNNILMDDFLSGKLINFDNIEHANIRIYKIKIDDKMIPIDTELEIELILK